MITAASIKQIAAGGNLIKRAWHSDERLLNSSLNGLSLSNTHTLCQYFQYTQYTPSNLAPCLFDLSTQKMLGGKSVLPRSLNHVAVS